MAAAFRNYSSEPFFTDDYKKVRDFLIRANSEKLISPRMLWGAWEWAVTHGGRDQNSLGRIGLWEDGGKVVAIVTYECPLGEAYLVVDEAYARLKPEMVAYAKGSLLNGGKLQLALPDGDCDFQRAALAWGFRPTQRSDRISVMDIGPIADAPYRLPDGFTYVSMADDWNWRQYNRVMWRGFDHE